MGWAKFSDDTHANEHILPLDHATFRLWVSSIWDNRGYKDGRSPFISKARAEALCRQQRIPRRSIKDIESAGRWEPTEGGWNIHDYSDYLPTRREDAEDVERDQKKQEAGRKGAAARWHPDSTPDGIALAEPKQGDSKPHSSRARGRVEPVPVPDVVITPDVVLTTPEPDPENLSKASPRSSPSTPADAIANGQTDDPVLKLGVGMHDLLGHALSGQDAIACQAALNQYAYMDAEALLQRAHEHIAHCQKQQPPLPVPRTVAGFSETWRSQNDWLADHGAPKAWRPSRLPAGLTRIGDVLPSTAVQRDPDE